MAKVMAYETPDGVAHAKSYWRPAQINIGIADKTANVTFIGYHSKKDYADGKASIGQRSYAISGPRFERLLAQLIAGQVNAVAMAYAVATEDAPDVPEEQRGFFATATDDL